MKADFEYSTNIILTLSRSEARALATLAYYNATIPTALESAGQDYVHTHDLLNSIRCALTLLGIEASPSEKTARETV